LSTVIQESGNTTFDFISLVKRWPEIVGKKLAQETIPLKNKQKTLVILTRHPGYAQGLNFMQVALKKKIIEAFPALERSINHIRFQYNPGFFGKKKEQSEKNKEKKIFHPYSPEHRKLKIQAEELLTDITDPQLKKNLVSLYLQIFTSR
ncbi:MAG: DciA family protein, partial [Halobacteriovoraceae bacterium]|nr:DciA family protein [Halobacteriovoraceae bacterium]